MRGVRSMTRAGVKLSDEEFHGIMAAVARRINRTANLGHPAAPPPGQFSPPGALAPMDDLLYRPQARPAEYWDQRDANPENRPNLPPPIHPIVNT